jgi:hypothetical protein
MQLERALPCALCLLAVGLAGAQPREGGGGGAMSYLDPNLPGATPAIFAPGIVSTGMYERDVALTPDGRQLYFTVYLRSFEVGVIVTCRAVDGRWSNPEVAPFSGDPHTIDIEPTIAPDGRRFLFASNRPRPGKSKDDRNMDLWVMERRGEGWGDPANLGAPVDSDEDEYFPSVTRDGTLYFTRSHKGKDDDAVFRSRLVGGRYTQPEKLPETVNAGKARFNAMVAPDDSFLLLSIVGLPDAIGATDYYVCFHNPDDSWSAPVNLGGAINARGAIGYSASLSPDGRYLFFMSSRPRTDLDRLGRLSYERLRDTFAQPGNGNPDIWWVDASFIAKLRPAGSTPPSRTK